MNDDEKDLGKVETGDLDLLEEDAFDEEYVKLNTRLETLNQNLLRLGGTVPDVKALLQNHLTPILSGIVSLLGAVRQTTEDVATVSQQALAMSERTLAGETLSFLVPGLFVFETYLTAHHPDPNAPIRRQFRYLLQACEGLREIFGTQYEEVAAALDQLVAEEGKATPEVTAAPAAPLVASDQVASDQVASPVNPPG